MVAEIAGQRNARGRRRRAATSDPAGGLDAARR